MALTVRLPRSEFPTSHGIQPGGDCGGDQNPWIRQRLREKQAGQTERQGDLARASVGNVADQRRIESVARSWDRGAVISKVIQRNVSGVLYKLLVLSRTIAYLSLSIGGLTQTVFRSFA
jgi:hypothetical protein